MVIADSVSVPANGVVDNVLTGKLGQFLNHPCVMQLFCTAAATGLRIAWNVGGEVAIDDALVSNANRFPLDPDDFLADIGGKPGDTQIMRVRNTTGGAIVFTYKIQCNDLA